MSLLKNNFFKFVIIGLISTATNYLVFIALYNLGIFYLLSSGTGYISGLILGYFLNKNYNFYLRNYKHTFVKYLVIYLSNLLVSLLILYVLVDIIELNVYIGNFIILIYTTIANYVGLKYYVFRNNTLLSFSISGNSGSGKTTLSKLLLDILGDDNTVILNGDTAHKWERHNKNWERITHLNPKGNNLKKEKTDVKKIINGLSVKRKKYNHSIGKHSKNEIINSSTFLVYEGLHGLHSEISELFDIKIFVESNFAEKSKINRDIDERNRDMNDLLKIIQKRKKDYNRYILKQRKQANICIIYEELENNSFITIDIKDGIDKKFKGLLQSIPGLKLKNNKITINRNTSYNVSKELLQNNGFNFIFEFNPDLKISRSYKGVFITILICLIQKYADNNTDGLKRK